ncbi:MAG: hypothetical protein QNK05_01405 [Myxococcota bacterium]|nr:hypothetical protein [Myxococcota bacterium]
MLNWTLRPLCAVAFAASLGLAAPSLAVSVTLFVDDDPANAFGVGAFGWEPADVANAMAAGLVEGPNTGFFSDDEGTRIMAEVLNNPITPDSNPTMPSKGDPVMATALFQFTALDQDYEDLTLVVLGKSPVDPTGSFYTPGLLGLEVDAADGWGLVRPDPSGLPDLYYLTLPLGELLQGNSVQIEVDYRVAQTLLLVDPGNPPADPPTFELPQLWIGFQDAAITPEAGGLVWVLPAFMSLLAIRRR